MDRDFKLSLPWVRVSFTNRARPNLASQAPSVRIIIGGRISIFVAIRIKVVIMIKDSVKASNLSRQVSSLFEERIKAIIGMIIRIIKRGARLGI